MRVERLNRIFAKATGQPLDKVARDTERNHWMTAEEARTYGLVGRIVEGEGDLTVTQVTNEAGG